jgi:hypothetical protein
LVFKIPAQTTTSGQWHIWFIIFGVDGLMMVQALLMLVSVHLVCLVQVDKFIWTMA